MSLTEILVTHAAQLATSVIESQFNEANSDSVAPNNLSRHLTTVANWSARVQVLGHAMDTDTESIELRYDATTRMFRGKNGESDRRPESSLLDSQCHHILFGDPGSGKSTSLKRIARTVLQSTHETSNDTCQYPILIRLSEIEQYVDMYYTIAETLGFPITVVEENIPSRRHNGSTSESGKERKVDKIPVSYIGKQKVAPYMASFLDESEALILIDGLDELRYGLLAAVLKDLRKMGLELERAKVIVTSRMGLSGTVGILEGFDTLDILPLDREQVLQLAAIWTTDADGFLRELNAVTYQDLTDRPLLLSQVAFIYQRYGELPKNPKEIYQLVIELLLKDWDADRHIVRRSAYSEFSVKRKAEFLAELAFRLMYHERVIRFEDQLLKEIYSTICAKYQLPSGESSAVAAEIETHTGIVVRSGYSEYEFSHLSLQEYLCADYIVRSPLSEETVRLIDIRPEPVAIAIALASDSTSWICNLVTDEYALNSLSGKMGPFLTRLVAEAPVFSPDGLLGYCAFRLFTCIHDYSDEHPYSKFTKLIGMQQSVDLLVSNRNTITLRSVTDSRERLILEYQRPRHHISQPNSLQTFHITKSTLDSFLKLFNRSVTELNISGT